MGRLNGIGTVHLGVEKNEADGTRWATYWFTFFFAPVLPLRRERLEMFDSHTGGYRYRVVERGSFNALSILQTLAFCWVLVPLMIVGPIIGMVTFSDEAPHIALVVGWIVWLGVWVWKLSDFHENRLHPNRK